MDLQVRFITAVIYILTGGQFGQEPYNKISKSLKCNYWASATTGWEFQCELTGAVKAAVLDSHAGQSGVAGARQAVIGACTGGTLLPIH